MGLIAIPTGKSLAKPTEDLFREARIDIARRHPRSCLGEIAGLPGIDRVAFCNPSDIPTLILSGAVDFGITGLDCVREHDSRDQTAFRVVTELEYSRSTGGGTKCVVFCKEDHPATNLSDMGAAPLIACEYPLETRDRLSKAGVSDARFVKCNSSEVFVDLGMCPYGVALVETGSTLRVNDMKVIAEIFESSTVLVGRAGPYSGDLEESITFLGRLLTGTLAARGKVYLSMNAPADKVDIIARLLPSLQSPTVKPLADSGFVAIDAVVPKVDTNALMLKLSREGASGFVTLPLSTVM